MVNLARLALFIGCSSRRLRPILPPTRVVVSVVGGKIRKILWKGCASPERFGPCEPGVPAVSDIEQTGERPGCNFVALGAPLTPRRLLTERRARATSPWALA